jgi:hypothetical protein
MLIIVAAAIVPMPLQWSMGGMIFGLLFFQLALVGSFESLLPNTRVYLDLRHETEALLDLVRDLNAAAVDARKVGMDPGEYTDPIVDRMHATVDRLPAFAGRPADGHLHLTPLAGRGFQQEDEVH